MSRWREMMMTYGQVFGDNKSSSDVYSIRSDLAEKRDEELQLRRTLEVHFRPLFQRFVYGGEKLACHDLKRLLRDPSYRNLLPVERVHELADVAEFNAGKAVTYSEFVRIVLGRQHGDDTGSFGSQNELSTGVRSSSHEGVLPVICRNTAQQVLVKDRLENFSWCPPPFFIIAVTLAQIVVYIVYAVTEAEDGETKALQGIPVPNDVMYMPTRRREVWRFITYFFLHQGYVDLIINVLIQLMLGVPLEIMFSFWRVATVYMCGIITGSLAQSVTDINVGLAGAGGGTMALISAHALALLQNWRHMDEQVVGSRTRRVLCSVTLRFLLMTLVAMTSIGLAVYRRYGIEPPTLIGFSGHVGGLVAGLFLGQAFFKDPKRYPWQEGAGYISLFSFLILLGGATVFNIAWPDYPDEDYT